jgi:hypothetical protein
MYSIMLHWKPRQIVLLTLLAALQFGATSCSLTKGREVGERAVDRFHNQLNGGQFREIYAESDDGFRKGTSEADTVALFEAVRRKLGVVKNAKQTSWRVNATPSGTTIALSYDVEYTEGRATEAFIFLLKEDKARLFNYNINSPLLITK